MPAFQSELNVGRLPAGVQQRFAACINGAAHPLPLWTARRADDARWKMCLPIGLLLAVALVIVSGKPTGWPWIAVWIPAAFAFALGVVGWLHARRSTRAFPFPAGTYLFATELFEVRDGVCHRFDLDGVVNTRLHTPSPGAAGREVQLIFPDDIVSLAIPDQQGALNVLSTFNAARSGLAQALADQAWDQAAALDPLYEARYGGAWTQYFQRFIDRSWKKVAGPAPGPVWLALPAPVWRNGCIAAVLLAPALWFTGNFVIDEFAFSRARSVGTVNSLRNYLKLPASRHRPEVYSKLLPSAALKDVKGLGAVSELQNFLVEYGYSPVADEARVRLNAIYDDAIGKARRESDATVREGMTGLLRYLRDNGSPKVEVRFGVTSQVMLASWETFLRENPPPGSSGKIAPISAAFSSENLRRREDAFLRLLRSGFASIGLGDTMTLERGTEFSGVPVSFGKPVIAIQWTANPVSALADRATDSMYLSLAFDFDLHVIVPKSPPTRLAFKVTPGDQLPAEFSGDSWYGGLIDAAFQEFQQRVAAGFFPSHAPARTIRLTSAPRRLTLPPTVPAPQPKANGPRSTATGFCISPLGCIVTAQHFTSGMKSFKVVTRDGKFDADLVREDGTNDLALLKIRGTLPTLSIRPATRPGRVGEKVATVGFPNPELQGHDPKYTEGTISSENGMKGAANSFQIAVNVQSGNSGGALVDQHGNVVGVVISKLNALKVLATTGDLPQNVNYAVKADYLLRFLATIPGMGTLPAPVEGEVPAGEILFERVNRATVLLEGY